MADRIFRLTNGVSYGARYTIAADDVAYAGEAEVVDLVVGSGATLDGDVTVTLPSLAGVTTSLLATATNEIISFTIDAGCSSSGNIEIKLSDALGYVAVAVLDTDDLNTEVAAKIAAAEASFTGWTVVADGAKVTFTKTAAGANVGAGGFQANATGVTLVAPGIVYEAIGYDAQDTAALVAAAIGAETYTGWTASVTDDTVTFTNDAVGAVTGTPLFVGTGAGVTLSTITVTTEGADAYDGEITFGFKSPDKDGFANYPLAANVMIVNDSNVHQVSDDLLITYPANGKVKIADGSTFKLTTGHKVSLVAQRADITAE